MSHNNSTIQVYQPERELGPRAKPESVTYSSEINLYCCYKDKTEEEMNGKNDAS